MISSIVALQAGKARLTSDRNAVVSEPRRASIPSGENHCYLEENTLYF